MPSSEVFKKYGSGNLHSGSKKGPVVKNHAQAVAIFLSEKRKEGQHGGKYPEKQFGGPQLATGQPPFPGHFGLNPASGLHGQGGLGHFENYTGPRDAAGVVLPRGMPSMSDFPGSLPTPQMLSQLQQAQPMLSQQPGAPMGNPMGMAGMSMRANGGGLGYQFGGSPTSMGLTPGWIERQEARNISHTGPIISAVGGRTDHHSINVPSGSYVLPAAHVSAMGQGNTLNGMKILQGMFGPPMKMPHGSGPPRMHAPPSLMPKTPGLGGMASGGFTSPPGPSEAERAERQRIHNERTKAMGEFNTSLPPLPIQPPGESSGGSRGDNTGRPVPILAAGGEFVLSPDQVARVGKGNIDHGHAILDHWVKKTHKKYAKTVANLPPPAKT